MINLDNMKTNIKHGVKYGKVKYDKYSLSIGSLAIAIVAKRPSMSHVRAAMIEIDSELLDS